MDGFCSDTVRLNCFLELGLAQVDFRADLVGDFNSIGAVFLVEIRQHRRSYQHGQG